MPGRPAFALLALAFAGGCSQPTGPERPISGEQLYNQYCARCHGVNGVPTEAAPTARSFADAAYVKSLGDEAMKGVIRAGRGQMPGFGDRFTDASLQVMVAYVRSLPEGRAEAPAGQAEAPAGQAEAPAAPAAP